MGSEVMVIFVKILMNVLMKHMIVIHLLEFVLIILVRFFCQCLHGYQLRLSPLISVTDIDDEIDDNPIISCGVINVYRMRFVLNLDVMKMLSALKLIPKATKPSMVAIVKRVGV